MTLFQTLFQLHTKKTKFLLRTSTSTQEDEALYYILPLQENVAAVKVLYKLTQIQGRQTAEDLWAWTTFLLPPSPQPK